MVVGFRALGLDCKTVRRIVQGFCSRPCSLLLKPQITHLFKDLHKEITIKKTPKEWVLSGPGIEYWVWGLG